MVEVAIQLSDETLERVKTHAEARETSAEQVIADAVENLFASHDPWLGFATEQEYRAFVQEGIDSADRGDLEDWDVVKDRLRAYIAERMAASAE